MYRLIELTAENFKRLTLAHIVPTKAVTPIIGKNGAGKTSVIDAYAAAVGGAKLCPEMPIRRGETEAHVKVNIGEYIVTRNFWLKEDGSVGTSLTVTSADGEKTFKSPQAILDDLHGQLSFDPLAFSDSRRTDAKKQAATLAKLCNIDLSGYEAKRKTLFERRAIVKKQAEGDEAAALRMPHYKEAPPELQSAADLLSQLKAVHEHNDAVKETERKLGDQTKALENGKQNVETMAARVVRLEKELEDARTTLAGWKNYVANQTKYLADMIPEIEAAVPRPTRDIEAAIAGTDDINRKVNENKRRADAIAAARAKLTAAGELTRQLDELDATFQASIAAAELPIPGLTFDTEGVKLDGIPFDQCSGAQRLRTSVAVGMALNPKMKIMLIRDGSLLDDDGMQLLNELAEAAGADVLIERVDNGNGECGVLIVDGSTVA